MAYTEFCCRSGGSNLNAGTRTGSSTEPGTAADFTYASGTWVQSTLVFAVASGNPQSDGVAVGDYASVYADGSTTTGFVGRVSAVSTTTITFAAGAFAGTAPTDGAANRTVKVGGAWQGPNGTDGFPFNAATIANLANAAGNIARINLKNSATYSVTAAISGTAAGPFSFRGYTTTYGDAGKATISGGTSGVSYIVLTMSGNFLNFVDLIFTNNGATGTANGVSIGGLNCTVRRCAFSGMLGAGATNFVFADECEFYSNTGAGFLMAGSACTIRRCIFHNNTGIGFSSTNTSTVYIENSIFSSNGSSGYARSGSGGNVLFSGCDFYNNTSDGITFNLTATTGSLFVENCNFVKNGGWGIISSGVGTKIGAIRFCGFGSGTQTNTSGQTSLSANSGIDVSTLTTYAANITPWVAPSTGNFNINLAAAKGTGSGSFTQLAGGFSGTQAYLDIGAGQHQDPGVLYFSL